MQRAPVLRAHAQWMVTFTVFVSKKKPLEAYVHGLVAIRLGSEQDHSRQ